MEMERLRDCIEEVTKFTLESHVNGTLGFDLRLSKDFCSNLIKPDPDDAVLPLPETTTTSTTDCFVGVPEYPLYKRLSSAIYHSITTSGAIRFRRDGMDSVSLEVKQKEEDWSKLIREEGSQLSSILKNVFCELHVQEPYFSLLNDGRKTIEGRCAGGDYERIKSGALILLNKSVVFEVQDVRKYASFAEMLGVEILDEVLPGVKTIDEGVKVYRKFYTEEREASNGVLAICVSKLVAQPYLYLANILSGLSYAGIHHLLGLADTVGTVSDVLPPPRSTLLSSFMLPYNPDVKGSALTHGARALAKHTERSSSKYWGILSGSDSMKNKLATDVIGHLIAHCCWLNVHIVPQHGIVFEIRLADGHGARWSKDGTKFIGFLEPYMEDGHSKGWKN